jgi:hypothetical protein
MLIADGVRLVKLFLHITPDEQMRRFHNRLANPLKRWKLSYVDFRNRGRWKDYETAIEDMMEKTSVRSAPWRLIPANNKPYGRLAALRSSPTAWPRTSRSSPARSIPRSSTRPRACSDSDCPCGRPRTGPGQRDRRRRRERAGQRVQVNGG